MIFQQYIKKFKLRNVIISNAKIFDCSRDQSSFSCYSDSFKEDFKVLNELKLLEIMM